MGKVRTEMVKRTARELMERYPDRLTADFEANKKAIAEFFPPDTKRLRNRVAGYATRLRIVEEARKNLETATEVAGETDSEQ